MQTSAFRVEVIRFSLLVTLTVALLSVAIRLASHSGPAGHEGSHATPSGTTSSLSPSSGPASTVPSTSPSAPIGAPTSPAPTSTATPATRAAGGGSSQPPTTQPVLPVTGYDAAIELAALSMVLIGAGALTVRASRRN